MIEISRQDSSSNIEVSSIDSSENVQNNVSLESELFQIIESKVADAGFVLQLGLSKQEIYVIHLLLTQQRGLFGDIGKHLSEIVADGKIDPLDIPNLILFAKDLIHMRNAPLSNLNIKTKDMIDFIENIMLILLQSGIIKTDNMKLYESLLKSSVALLESTIDLKETTCKCSLWPWF